MKDAIVHAAVRVLIRSGLNKWTVDEVARQAGCAKGLVNYHHRSKEHLLRLAAQTLRDDRWASRLAAVTDRRADALDRLWATLLEEVRVGRFAAWLSCLASPPLREAAATLPAQSQAFALALAQSLGIGDQLPGTAGMIEAALDGLELRLLQGVPAAQAEEAYHQSLLVALEM